MFVKTITAYRDRYWKLNEDFESSRLKVNLDKANLMVSGIHVRHEAFVSAVDACRICCLMIKANSFL